MLRITSKLKWLKAWVREELYHRRNIHSCSNFGGSSQNTRSHMYNHGECTSQFNSTRERTALDRAAQQDGRKLKEAVAMLMYRVNQGMFVNPDEYNHVLKWFQGEGSGIREAVKRFHQGESNETTFLCCKHASKVLHRMYQFGDCTGAIQEPPEEGYRNLDHDDRRGCAKHDKAEDATEMYKQMRNEGVQRNAITYLSVLKACASPSALQKGENIHAHIISDGFQADLRVGNALVHMYAKTGLIADAKLVFDNMPSRDVISWNAMIGGLAELGLGLEAFSLFLQMQREGISPNAITCLSILNPCSSAGAVEWLKVVQYML